MPSAYRFVGPATRKTGQQVVGFADLDTFRLVIEFLSIGIGTAAMQHELDVGGNGVCPAGTRT